ncbi:HprK-related kinase A [Roseateles saccharophilus]|uniref:Hpr(Ser) kinase/phosphatase n=1 Tax=Roseateles saccharophilus TaxID=304 RepID=A0A4R3V1L2_ROSSA|nr:HprK-related kinase A [Roseateles saccharophilus]MDG0831877.1 HprK-related kinase A [Roseateles saccharophilus]TCU97460.1 Hpr(Ser) kinase/phosphatase [Roseateles saccharophilus]
MFDATLHIPPFNVRLRSPFAAVRRHVHTFYPRSVLPQDSRVFIDFDIEVLPGRGLRRVWRPQARFLLDGAEPFFPLPAAQAAPMFEWGMNWCVAQRPMGWLVMHGAVLARDGAALVMPGFPGAGKSTLCASLAFIEGWRLLSDELTVLDPSDGLLVPHPRPISLKNNSIGVVTAFPGAHLGPIYRDTRKGTITHAACPPASMADAAQRARAAWIVFPRFEVGAALRIEQISRVEAFTLISEQSFNGERMGGPGFDALCAMFDHVTCHELVYGSTDGGLEGIRRICTP